MIEIIQLKIMQCIAEEAKTRCKYKVHFKNFRSFTGSIFEVWIKSKFHIEKFDILITSIIWMNTFWFKDFFRLVCLCLLIISVGSEPKLGSARLGFGSSFWEKKLGSARLAISCKKSSVQLGLLYHLKKRGTLKNKKWADFQHFCQFFKV